MVRLITRLPFGVQKKIGTALAYTLLFVSAKRRHVVQTNIRLCFPELSDSEQRAFVRDIFIANSIGFFEIASAWWANPNTLADRFTVEGLEHIEAAKKDGHGVLLISGHFVHLDLCGIFINHVTPIDVVYRPNNNPVMEQVVTQGRQRFLTPCLIDRMCAPLLNAYEQEKPCGTRPIKILVASTLFLRPSLASMQRLSPLLRGSLPWVMLRLSGQAFIEIMSATNIG